MVELILLVPLLAATASIAYAGILASWVLKQPAGTPEMQAISHAVKQGASAFLAREYRVIFPLAAIIAAVITLIIRWEIAVGFLVGAGLSALAGYLGMAVTVRCSSRAAEAARRGMGPCLTVSFRAGAVMGMCIAGLGLLGVTLLYLWLQDPLLIVGIGFGASLIAMFIRVGGGIYTKAADLGADLVGKVEAGIPEDDPRNPAVIADNVGDNVGDVAGMGSDVFESYAVIAIAAMLLAYFAFTGPLASLQIQGIIYPLMLGAVGLLGSVVGTFFVYSRWKGEPMRALDNAFYASVVASSAISFAITRFLFPANELLANALWLSSVLGFIVVIVLMRITDYYTSYRYPLVRMISEASQTGPPTNFLAGLAVGLKSTFPFMLTLIGAIIISFALGYLAGGGSLLLGIYATATATMGMLALSGIVMSIDSFGPVSDNANGIVEMAGLGEVREVTDRLDAIGNTTKATTKGFAIGSAALSALALFQAFRLEIPHVAERMGRSIPPAALNFSLNDPLVIVGLIVGGLLPFFFSSYLILAVGRTGMQMVEEVRRQFREIPGIMTREAKPDYARCVDIATRGAIRELAAPALLAILTPVAIGIILGPRGVGGLLIGSIVSGVFLAYMMTNGGGAMDNAKKYIELGNYGGKHSPAHAAAVMGDTVGDPLKDTAGPSINPLIKVLNTISIIFVPVIIYTSFLAAYL